MRLKDCYKIDDVITLNYMCFASFNSTFSNSYSTSTFSILIPDSHNTWFSKRDFLFYLNTLNKIVPIKFKISYDSDNEWYELKFIIDKNKHYKKHEMVFTTMLIRCVYEQDIGEKFHRIVYHFLKLLRLRNIDKNIDLFKLFSIAHNIFIKEYKDSRKSEWESYNTNHILAELNGCKITPLNKVLDDLRHITHINDYFNTLIDLNDFKLSKSNNYKQILKNCGCIK